MNNHVLPVVALLAAIGIFFFYVNPTWTGSIAETKAAIASDDQALAAANEYSAQQNQLTSAQKAIDASNLSQLATFLPDSVDNVQLILDLNSLAARTGLVLSNVSVAANAANDTGNTSAQTAPTSPVNSANLSLSAIGTYGSLQTFLQELEKSRRLLDVRDLTVKSSNTGVYSYQMTIRLYWLR